MSECVYLDSAAAMPVRGELLDSFKDFTLRYPANPEALHSTGREASLAISRAGEQVVSALPGGDEHTLTWSSSATEAINMVFMFPYFKGKVVLTTDSEHPAMQYAIERASFCEVRKVPIMANGLLDMQQFEEKLDSDVAVVAIHHAQNETGALQDLCEVSRIMNSKAPDAIFIVDTVQSVAKLAIPWEDANINIAFLGGHKIGAPSGGAVISNFYENYTLRTLFKNHLDDLRSSQHRIGRPDTAICMTLAEAVIYGESAPLCKATYLSKKLRADLADLAAEKGLDIILPTEDDSATPYIVTTLIPPFQSEILVRMLADKGVMISAGSACEASKSKPSQALMAVAGSEKSARCALRISFSYQSKIDEIDKFISALSLVLDEY